MKALDYVYIQYICLHLCVYVCIFLYMLYTYTQHINIKAFVRTDRKGEATQVSVSCCRANKPGGVLSDAAMLLH